MDLPFPIQSVVSRRAINSLADFYRSVGEQPPADSILSNLIFASLYSFLDEFKDAPFLTKFKRHSFAGASIKQPGMDNENVLMFHVENQGERWFVGTPGEFPLDPVYEQNRVIDEARLVLDRSEKL